MAIDAFLKIEGIPGESLDAQFKDWIEMDDFDVGASQFGLGHSHQLRRRLHRTRKNERPLFPQGRGQCDPQTA